MNRNLILFILVVFIFAGCKKENQPASDTYNSSTEMIQIFVNNSLIGSDELSTFINERRSGDSAAILKMILDYNNENDKADFQKSIENVRSSNELKKKLLILSENM